MPLPATNDLPADVIEGHDPQRRTRWRPSLLAVGGGVAGVLVSVTAMVATQDDTAAVVEASGAMIAEHRSSVAADRPHSTATWEDKNAKFSGPIHVHLPDRQLIGFAELTFSFAANLDDDAVWITHSWGQVHATFDSTSCDGPITWSFYREPHETGGSMSLRCSDGSLLAATLLMERYEDETADHNFRVFFTLEDGSYVAG